ncbi:MAG: trypsin-like peptidase domain-containing protein [Caldilineaceae bacterium]|nr:trypsin-like peptidase domain-containing protein [Caldilineaceae bacterium]
MRNRKNIAFGTAILVLALAFGVGANQWVEPGESWAAALQQTLVNDTAVANLAEIDPTQELLANLYQQAAPSVVNIQVTATMEGQAQGGLPFPFGNGGSGDVPVQGQGSGFIYDNDGHIVTNNHVVENATSLTVYFSNGMWSDAEVVATDPSADLAVIKVTPPEGMTWQPLTLAPANGLRVGYTVVALGSPFGLQETMTTGIVSALGRSVPTDSGTSGSSYSLPDVIQTDTAINPGNSGGPLLNLAGEVVGVNFAINTTSGSNSGVGFAIPVSVIEKIVPALIADGGYQYSYLGIAGTSVNARVADEFKLDANTLGIYVAQVVANGPAGDAGVQEGDIITAVNDQAITDFDQLISYLFNATTPGQTITLHLLRDGKETTADITVEARPSPTVAQEDGASQMDVSLSEAIRIAVEAVREAGLMDNVEGASAKANVTDGRAVWVVTLTNSSQTGTVVVDGTTGEVLELNVG